MIENIQAALDKDSLEEAGGCRGVNSKDIVFTIYYLLFTILSVYYLIRHK